MLKKALCATLLCLYLCVPTRATTFGEVLKQVIEGSAVAAAVDLIVGWWETRDVLVAPVPVLNGSVDLSNPNNVPPPDGSD